MRRDDTRQYQDDPDAIFPPGCLAEIPDCSGFYAGSLRAFSCEGDSVAPDDAGVDAPPPAEAHWSELL